MEAAVPRQHVTRLPYPRALMSPSNRGLGRRGGLLRRKHWALRAWRVCAALRYHCAGPEAVLPRAVARRGLAHRALGLGCECVWMRDRRGCASSPAPIDRLQGPLNSGNPPGAREPARPQRPCLNGRAGHLVASKAVIDLSELLRLDVSLRHGDQVFRLGVPAVAQTTPLSRLSCRWIRQGR